MPDEHGHFSHEHKDAPPEQWTNLQALNLETGDVAWTSTCGVNMGCIPLPVTGPDGSETILVGRGGGHSPPESREAFLWSVLSMGKRSGHFLSKAS